MAGMKLQPAQLTTPKQVRVYEKARGVMETIDKCLEATRHQDGKPGDHLDAPGAVTASNLLVEQRPAFSDVSIEVASSELKVNSAVLQADGSFTAQVSLPGMWGLLPIGLDADVSRVEKGDQVVYDQRITDSVSGPNRCKVIVDRATGEVDYREYWFGFLRKPV